MHLFSVKLVYSGIVAAFFLSATGLGQAMLAILVAVVGYWLHHKATKIEVLVDGRMTAAIARIDLLEARLAKAGEPIPPAKAKK